MKRTKIICTIGPAIDTIEKLIGLMENGMDCARFNFSHGTHDSQKIMMDMVKKARQFVKKPVAILLDTKGPEIRLKDFVNGQVELKDNQFFILDNDEITLGDENRIGITYHDLYKHIKIGTQILLDDGKIELRVEDIQKENIITKVIHGGKLSNHKAINVPNVELPMVYLSEVDKSDILFGIEQHVEFIAASFVRSKQDIIDLRNFLKNNGGEKIEIIAKIENIQGVNNLDEIIDVSDGVMVARGDLGVEIPFINIPSIQKQIIDKCNEKGKFSIVATQMLESMTNSIRPTRAEISDVANAVFDGAGVIMLSGETASGLYPLQAVKTMADIAEAAEKALANIVHKQKKYKVYNDISETICKCAYQASEYLSSKAIVVVTRSGRSAKQLAIYKPKVPVIAITLEEVGGRQLALYYNTTSIKAEEKTSFEELLEYSKEMALKTDIVHKNDTIIIVIGSLESKSYSDTLRICTL